MTLISEQVLAYVNHGRWVAECPRVFCRNALALDGSETVFACAGQAGGCGQQAIIRWPENAQEIWDALGKRPVASTRNWFPFGHPLAEQMGLPMGQSPRDLIDEQKEMENLGAR